MACFSQAQQNTTTYSSSSSSSSSSATSDTTNTCGSLDKDLLYGYFSGFLIARISLLTLYWTATAFNSRACIQFKYSIWIQYFVITYVMNSHWLKLDLLRDMQGHEIFSRDSFSTQ